MELAHQTRSQALEAAAQPGSIIPRLSRREFFRFGASLAAIPVAGVVADELLELLTPRATILLPAAEGVWSVSTLGGYFYSRELSKVLRHSVQPLVRFRQFTEHPRYMVVGAEKLTWDVFKDATV